MPYRGARAARWRCSARSTATSFASSTCPACRWSCAAARTCATRREIGLFRIIAETGVASGVRRIEALTGPARSHYLRERERALASRRAAEDADRRVKTTRAQLLDERRALEKKLEEAMRGGGDELQQLVAARRRSAATGRVSSSVRCARRRKGAAGDGRRPARAARQRRRRRGATRRQGRAAGRGDGRPACDGRARRRIVREVAGVPVAGAAESRTWRRRESPTPQRIEAALERGAEAGRRAARERVILSAWLDARRPIPPPAASAHPDRRCTRSLDPTRRVSDVAETLLAAGERARA